MHLNALLILYEQHLLDLSVYVLDLSVLSVIP